MLTFAFLLRIVPPFWRGADASTDETAARNPRLPERIHHPARLRAEPRRDRPTLRPFFARDRPQAPDQPAGKGLHQARVESEPIGRDGSDANRRTRCRVAAARLRRRRPADRGGRLERNDRGARGSGRGARHLRAARSRRLDDRRADPRRRLRRRRGSQVGRQRRDGHRARCAAPTSRSRSSTAIPAARFVSSRRTSRCSRSSSIPTRCRFRASSSA